MLSPPESRATSIADWFARDEDPGAGNADLIAASDCTWDDGWIAVPAPGDIYLALQEAGRLPDPFMDENEAACAWVKTREWWWRTSFAAPDIGADDRLMLIFHGLDTFATIWLNGSLLGRSGNMFRAAWFDVGALVKPGRGNVAVIRFDPASESVHGRSMKLWPIISDPIEETKRNFIRKAQFGWGWDWAPRLPTVGIWRPVELRLQTRAVLKSVYFRTVSISAGDATALLRVEVETDNFSGLKPLTLDMTLSSPGGQQLSHLTGPVSGPFTGFDFILNSPDLWWTPELGRQPLHTLSIVLRSGSDVLDSDQRLVGIRTIRLDHSPDPGEPGTEFFRFVLNDVPIFARGACWVPASSFLGALSAPQYRRLIEAAGAANMNMLRIWGGGIYEHEAFYDICDELGILVWQDFMFACAPYPEDDPDFVENVTAEVRAQIRRLRNHPCLALWCGNNEAQAVQGFINRMTGGQDLLSGRLYYDEIMPDAVHRLDPATPYWPGSPTGGPSHNSMRAGDVHSWTVWHGLPPVPDELPVGDMDFSPAGIAYTRYAEDMARFVSEFGIQAAPVKQTLQNCLPSAAPALGSTALENRIKDKPKDKINGMLLPVTGLPRDIDDYINYSQIVQAEGLKFGIEHFRRRKPHCSGTLIWQYNDCWPCISWSLVDYDGFGKAGYYYTRRAYEPCMASFKQLADGSVELWVTNDTLHAVLGNATVSLQDFHTGLIWQDEFEIGCPPNSSEAVWRATVDRLAGSPSHVLMVTGDADLFPQNRMFFAQIKDLVRPRATPRTISIEQIGARGLRVQLQAGQYAFFVHLLVPHGWTDFSDNYFDMRAGERRTIDITHRDICLRPEDITVVSL